MGAVLSFFGRIFRAIGNGIMGLISLIAGFLNAIVSAITDLFVCIFTCGRGSRGGRSRKRTRAGGL
ncbi:hypothetical protein P389DRAFT_207166 [Cystobasidium minutum MCA 4210]|uniref:uncharacterized protein n=1 Tax=Cystobasidium minutum MCA 4210 TaxID=1397322 RepID=UPI0034CEB96F|eukprot:jgi/Rhomi1/207166/estExt_Genemark1.C_1_t10031